MATSTGFAERIAGRADRWSSLSRPRRGFDKLNQRKSPRGTYYFLTLIDAEPARVFAAPVTLMVLVPFVEPTEYVTV